MRTNVTFRVPMRVRGRWLLTRLSIGVCVLAFALSSCSSSSTKAQSPMPHALPTAGTTTPPPSLCNPNVSARASTVVEQADQATEGHDYALATSLYNTVLTQSGFSAPDRTCAARGLAVIADRTQSTPSSATTAASAWDGLYSHWISPLVRALTPALVAFALLLALTRLLTRILVGAGTRTFASRLSNITFGVAYWLAVAGVALAAVGATVGTAWALDGSHSVAVRGLLLAEVVAAGAGHVILTPLFWMTGRRVSAGPVVTTFAVAVGLAGLAFGLVAADIAPGNGKSALEAVLISLALAVPAVIIVARIRGIQIGLQIQGRSKGVDDAALGESVRVRLLSLGSQRPRGVQFTEQTDVSSLPSDALALLPEGTIAKAFTLLLQVFTPSAPWRVLVSELPAGDISVVLSRNGKAVDAQVIRPTDVGLSAAVASASSSGSDSDGDTAIYQSLQLHVAAAAFILTTLRDRYQHLSAGLNGASNWRSIATQALATNTLNRLSQDDRLRLLTYSVAFDAGNVAAQVARLTMQYRQGADAKESLDFARGLRQIWELPGRDWDAMKALRLRVLFNLSVGWYNYSSILRKPDVDITELKNPPTRAWALVVAKQTIERLQKLVVTARNNADLSALADQIEVAAAYVAVSIAREFEGRSPVTSGMGRGRSADLDGSLRPGLPARFGWRA